MYIQRVQQFNYPLLSQDRLRACHRIRTPTPWTTTPRKTTPSIINRQDNYPLGGPIGGTCPRGQLS